MKVFHKCNSTNQNFYGGNICNIAAMTKCMYICNVNIKGRATSVRWYGKICDYGHVLNVSNSINVNIMPPIMRVFIYLQNSVILLKPAYILCSCVVGAYSCTFMTVQQFYDPKLNGLDSFDKTLTNLIGLINICDSP